MSPYWSPWIIASINEWFRNSSFLSGQPVYYESDAYPSPETLAKQHGHWIEVRVDGPVWNQHAKMWEGRLEINTICSVVKNISNSLYLPRILAGKVEATYARQIPIYRFGPTSDEENDGTYFDCLQQSPFRGTDNAIVTGYLGQIEPNVPIEQISVESHYILEREVE